MRFGIDANYGKELGRALSVELKDLSVFKLIYRAVRLADIFCIKSIGIGSIKHLMQVEITESISIRRCQLTSFTRLIYISNLRIMDESKVHR